MPDVTAAPCDRLDSWKEIAAYLSRGVRTVRRWEHEEGLPVHRQMHRVQGSVYAFRSEIDAWRKTDERRTQRRSADASSAALALRQLKSIAVLPFANLSVDPENAFFADGLTDEVTADLSKVQALRVISRTSSMTFKDTAKDVKTIARELGVRYVLEGSVRRAGDRLRITAQLIDAGTDDHLWADQYDGTVEDIFAFQGRLAHTIVDALELRLSSDERRRLAERPIVDLHAHESYLRARQEGWRWRKDAIDHAVELLEAGIDFSGQPLLVAEACAERVFALEPSSVSGLRLRGWIHYSCGRIQDAVRDLKAALAIDANNPDALGLLANCYLISGKVAAARPVIERLIAVDPLTPMNRCMPGFADIMEGRFAAAADAYRQTLDMDPGNPMARLFYVWVLVLNGRTDEVRSILQTFPVEVHDTFPARLAFFMVDALDGNTESLRAMMTPDLEAVALGSDVFARLLAQGYALGGMTELALRWLAIAIDRGFVNHPFLARYDPFFEPIRTDPRFARLMDIAHERWTRFEA